MKRLSAILICLCWLPSCSRASSSPKSSKSSPSASGSSASTDTSTTTSDENKQVTVSWTANREKAVNSAGGGYVVYYGTQSGFSVSSSQSVRAAYASGSLAPTSATISGLSSGTYYIKVMAYSSTNSSLSGEVSVSVP